MSQTRKNKMSHWKTRRNKSFPMTSRNVTCVQCGKSTTKKQTLMRGMETAKAYNKNKEYAMVTKKSGDVEKMKRHYTPVVVKVSRICRGGCNRGE